MEPVPAEPQVPPRNYFTPRPEFSTRPDVEEAKRNPAAADGRQLILYKRDLLLKRDMLDYAHARLVRARLVDCYRTSGVNALNDCRLLAVEYLRRLGANPQLNECNFQFDFTK